MVPLQTKSEKKGSEAAPPSTAAEESSSDTPPSQSVPLAVGLLEFLIIFTGVILAMLKMLYPSILLSSCTMFPELAKRGTRFALTHALLCISQYLISIGTSINVINMSLHRLQDNFLNYPDAYESFHHFNTFMIQLEVFTYVVYMSLINKGPLLITISLSILLFSDMAMSALFKLLHVIYSKLR